MIPLFHRGGPVPCFGPAFGIKVDMPFPRHDLPADNVLKLDGRVPQRGEAVLCGSCGNPVHSQWLYKQP